MKLSMQLCTHTHSILKIFFKITFSLKQESLQFHSWKEDYQHLNLWKFQIFPFHFSESTLKGKVKYPYPFSGNHKVTYLIRSPVMDLSYKWLSKLCYIHKPEWYSAIKERKQCGWSLKHHTEWKKLVSNDYILELSLYQYRKKGNMKV